MSHICSFICSPAVALVTGSCLTRVLKDVKLQGHQLCGVGHKLWIIHLECHCWRCVTL